MTIDSDRAELEALTEIVGEPVVAFERAAWGFENHTAIVTLAQGRRLVVQRIASRSLAPHKLRLARLLPDRLAAAGIRIPRLLTAAATADPPYAVREYIPGVAAATFMRHIEGAVMVAAEMGVLLRRLRNVSTEGAGLHSGWANPARLEQQARRQLDRCRALFDTATIRALAATIDEVPARFAGRGGCFAHGDFCPVNALLEPTGDRRPNADDAHRAYRVVALLDVEFARLADPLFDAAWWGWVVRYHHPERWVAAWPVLLEAAGIAADEATLERIFTLQKLRCLEIVDYTAAYGPEAQAIWVQRLKETLGWSR